MTRQEALEQLLSPYQALVGILAGYPEHQDFIQGANWIRTGMLVIKEGIECSNFDDVKSIHQQLVDAKAADIVVEEVVVAAPPVIDADVVDVLEEQPALLQEELLPVMDVAEAEVAAPEVSDDSLAAQAAKAAADAAL